MYKKLFIIPLALSVLLFGSCNFIKDRLGDKSGDDETEVSSGEGDGGEGDRAGSDRVAPITRDLDFMIFMHQFASDADFQMKHVKFPLGKLTYAYDMETGRHDSFKSCYWIMQDMDNMNKYFTWKNDNKIVYFYDCYSEGECFAEFEYTYTFEKIGGVWYVTKGDYHFSDVGLTEYTAEMAAESQQAFRRKHKGGYTPYVYNGTPGDYPEASDRLLTESDLRGMSKADLRLMRNEIMARHGYTFASKDLREHFESQRWYYPLFKNVSNHLSDIENQNVKFIQAHEK